MTPRSVSANDRRSEECAIPRDFRIDRWRPPCPPGGALRSMIHVSIRDEIPTSTSGAAALP